MKDEAAENSGLVKEAYEFASRAHAGQYRKGAKRLPYISHIDEGLVLLRSAGGTEIELTAFCLHDVVEDCGVSIDEIRSRFGTEVAEIVAWLTDLPEWKGLPTAARKRLQAERIAKAPPSARRLKIVDQTANLQSLCDDPPVGWSREACLEYLEGAREIVESATIGNMWSLGRAFIDAYTQARESLPPS